MVKVKTISRALIVLLIGFMVWVVSINLSKDSRSMSQIRISGPTTLSQQQLPDQAQGVRGDVLQVTGNQMPPLDAHDQELAQQPVRTKVWIFSGRVTSSSSPRWPLSAARQHPGLMGWTVSNSEGKFEVGLPPGEYTLLVEYGSDLYLNRFLGDGSYASVQVAANQITEVQLVNTENAVF
jgi:hypothetical protein